MAGRLASSAVTAEEADLPRPDRCSLQPTRPTLAGNSVPAGWYIYVRNGILTHVLSALPAIAVEPFHRSGRKSDRCRLFTLVGRPDREVICAQIIRLWAPPPGSHGPRCGLR